MNDKTSYPLCWPDGWPRTVAHKRAQSRFQRSVAYSSSRFHSMDDACGLLAAELDRIGGGDAVFSTNVRVRLDGKPYSNQAQPGDSGAAVYFKMKGKPVSLACDKWKRVECNVYAIAKHVEALRGQERWGVGSVEQAFRGYMALPAIGQTSGDNPWHVLGVAVNASEEQITRGVPAAGEETAPGQSTGGRRRTVHAAARRARPAHADREKGRAMNSFGHTVNGKPQPCQRVMRGARNFHHGPEQGQSGEVNL